MKFRLPRKSQVYERKRRIGRQTWTIQVVDEINEDGRWGECDYNTKTIKLKRRIGQRNTAEIYIHELLHAFEDVYKIKLGHRRIYALQRAILDYLLRNH